MKGKEVSIVTSLWKVRSLALLLMVSITTVGIMGFPSGAEAATTAIYMYTGSNQTFTVPTGVTSVTVKMWGLVPVAGTRALAAAVMPSP